MSASQSGGSESHAAKLLTEFLSVSHANLEADFETLCKTHPEEDSELRALFTAERQARLDISALGPPAESHTGDSPYNTVDAKSVFRRLLRKSGDSDYAEGARIGDVIGDFKLIHRIASGGQGEVWEAEQISLGRRVAFKLVRPDRINERALALFAREARAGGRLAHPGIVAVYGHGENDGRHWISQELVEGGWTLRDFIDDMRGTSELPKNYYRAVAIFLAELADALQAAHEENVIHRDVKPQNVLVTKDQHPKLTDFGLARITDELAISVTGNIAGTWLYMSPEQVTAKRAVVDHRSDIFSLGIVMYEMLALTRPFDGDTTHQVAEKIIHAEPPNLHEIRSRVPHDLSVICAKALEKRKDNRYQTASDFAADIRRHLANEPIHAEPPTALERAVKWVQRHPTKSVIMTSVSIALVVISWLGLGLAESNSALEIKTQEATDSAALADLKAEEAQMSATLARANALLADSKAAEALANAERADAEAAEAKRKTRDVLRLSLGQDFEDLILEAGTLWPGHPKRIDSLRAWVTEANALSEELPTLIAKRDELRSLATPLNKDETRTERETHPEFSKLAPMRAELDSKRAALATRRGETEPEVASVNWSDYPTDANELNGLAWKMVDPERVHFGQEALGLALALRATELALEKDKAAILDSVAWGHFALGNDTRALEASHEALALAPKAQHASFQGYVAKMESAIGTVAGTEALSSEEAALSQLFARLETLEARVNERRAWTFPTENESETRARWWHNQVTGLITKIESLTTAITGLLTADGVSDEHGWSIARRLEHAERLDAGFAQGGEFAARWAAAESAIVATYPGLNLRPQMGLVPIGADPTSKLWEFWDVQSGSEPVRDEAGALQIEDDTGLVFVLLRGGKFWMGAQAEDPEGQNFSADANSDEGPVHEVELSAFFMSKYEMTQGQWQHLTGKTPSRYSPGEIYGGHTHDSTHPVEQLDWDDCMAVLPNLHLTLPSEAQWEYSTRGGSTTPWWTGHERESLKTKTAANIADQSATRVGAIWTAIKDWPELDDGYAVHCPVDAYAANPFGLHNVHGNLWEWCLDGYSRTFYAEEHELDPVNPPANSADRITRGGSFVSDATSARASYRYDNARGDAGGYVGFRPARVCD